MYARVTTFQGVPERLEEGIRTARERLVPQVRQLPGSTGLLLLVDRQRGKTPSLTLWESAGALRASAEAVGPIRAAGTEAVGASGAPTVEQYDVVVQE